MPSVNPQRSSVGKVQQDGTNREPNWRKCQVTCVAGTCRKRKTWDFGSSCAVSVSVSFREKFLSSRQSFRFQYNGDLKKRYMFSVSLSRAGSFATQQQHRGILLPLNKYTQVWTFGVSALCLSRTRCSWRASVHSLGLRP